jgi:hypothetical protein
MRLSAKWSIGGSQGQRSKSKSKSVEEEEYDNDLMTALSEIPLNQLASIDEAFVILDGGLGAIFSASMARRAAVSRSLSSEKSGSLTVNEPSVNETKNDTKNQSKLQAAMSRIVNPFRKMKAQQATMNMLTDLAGAGHDGRRLSFNKDAQQDNPIVERPGTPFALDSDTDSSGEDELRESQQLPADESLREWAKEYLNLAPARLKGLEASDAFREKLGHQMLCWQASRADKLGVRPSTAPSVISLTGSTAAGSTDLSESEFNGSATVWILSAQARRHQIHLFIHCPSCHRSHHQVSLQHITLSSA